MILQGINLQIGSALSGEDFISIDYNEVRTYYNVILTHIVYQQLLTIDMYFFFQISYIFIILDIYIYTFYFFMFNYDNYIWKTIIINVFL